MTTPCLECIYLAPIKRIPEGDPREIQVGHQGMLARGLAECALRDDGQTYRRFRSISATGKCPRFERVRDKERIANRKRLAARLQAAYQAWIQSRREK